VGRRKQFVAAKGGKRGSEPQLQSRGLAPVGRAMGGVIAAILIAAAVSDSLGDVRAWTLVTVVAAAYIISRGLAKAGSRYSGGDDPLNRDNR
jgi:hypothetical protein